MSPPPTLQRAIRAWLAEAEAPARATEIAVAIDREAESVLHALRRMERRAEVVDVSDEADRARLWVLA